MNKTGKGILRNVTKYPWAYGTLAGALLGLNVSLHTYNYLDDTLVKPRAATVELNKRIRDVFETIVSEYYDSTIRRQPNIKFYNQPPAVVLHRLKATKKTIDDNREFLTETGYISRLQEHNLDLSIKRVESFIDDYPQKARDWYGYLYAGSSPIFTVQGITPSPPTYAQEIKAFYEKAEEARVGLMNTPTERVLRNSLSLVAGSLAAVLFWARYPKTNASLRNWYKKIASKEDLEEKLEKLKAFD